MSNFQLIVNNIILDCDESTIDSFAIISFSNRSDGNLLENVQNTFSTDFTLPNTPTNRQALQISNDLQLDLKTSKFALSLLINGNTIESNADFIVDSIDNNTIKCFIIGKSSNWIKKLQSIDAKKIGYVDGKPTWFSPFRGAETINVANNTDGSTLIFPTILYNNTPKTDYGDFTKEDVYGLYDSTGNQIKAPLTFPDSFKCEAGFFGDRLGLTYQDFPPAVNYRQLLEKCFNDINFNVESSLFNEEWFNKIYIPYTGSGYKYNWKTLSKLELLLRERTTIGFVNADNSVGRFINGTNYTTFMQNIMLDDNVAYRIDYIYNYKKFLVSDESVESKYRIGQYIVPTNGNYNIRYKGDYSFVGTGSNLNNFGSRWQDVILVFVRVDENGEPVYDESMEDLHNRISHWFANEKDFIAVNPNDLIAYVSLNSLTTTGEQSDIYKAGSPLTNNEKKVNINSYAHTIITDTNSKKESYFEIDMSIDNVTLYKNERVIAFYVGLSAYGSTNFSSGSMEVTINSSLSNLYIDYACGYEDINISENLPFNGSSMDIVSSFIKQFNLDYFVVGNTITFIPNYFNSFVSNLEDITKYVIPSTIKRSILKTPKELKVGYTIDENDRLLNEYSFGCDTTEITSNSEYGNVVINLDNYDNNVDNIESLIPFSSTLFYKSNVRLIDCIDAIRSFSYLDYTSFPPKTIKKVDYGTSPLYTGEYYSLNDNYKIPSIQSKSQFEVKELRNLDYNFQYKPRLFYHLGTLSQHYGIDTRLRIPIDAPESDLIGGNSPYYYNHFIELTVSSFDTENNNPYPSLRFDTNLYEKYFSFVNDQYTKNGMNIVECEMRITNTMYEQFTKNPQCTLHGRRACILSIDGYKLNTFDNDNIPVKLLLL